MVTDIAPTLNQLSAEQGGDWHYRDAPGKYAPLVETELPGSLEERVQRLAIRRDQLEEQLFSRIQRRRVGTIEENHFEYKLPEPVFVESDWQTYLQGEANYHQLAKRQAEQTHNVEATRQHELEAQRISLAIDALNGGSRGDLVVDYAKRIQAKTHQAIEVREEQNRRLGTSSVAIQDDLLHAFSRLWVRADFCDKVVAAMEQRFPQK